MKKSKRILLLLLVFLTLLSVSSSALSADGIGRSEDATIRLTAEEKAFIAQHPVVYLGVDPSSMPYEFFDTDGEYKGITADYVELICERTGLNLVPVENVTWTQAYEMGVEKKLDVLSCVAKTEARQKYFLFSDPYITFQRVIFVNSDTDIIHSLKDLYGKSAAVQAESSHEAFLASYVSIDAHPYPTVEQALEALSSGQETAFIGNLATTIYLGKLDGITNLKYVAIENEEPQEYCFAVRSDWPLLVSILNKALSGISKEEKTAINNKWIGVERDVNYPYLVRAGIIAGSVIVLVLIVSAFWIVKLRKEIKAREIIQRELRAAKEDAEQANATKSLFLARMSHEIRTPLNAVMGMTHLLRKTNLSTTQKLYLGKLAEAADNMLGVINDILDFSKVEAGKIELETVSFDLDRLLARVVSIISVRVENRGVEFSLQRDPALSARFFGDPTRIEQILLNLVNNAVKFTEHGSVTLSVRAGTLSGGACIDFTVADTGIGMTKEQVGELFKPFYQADASIGRRFGGTGLGLSITKALADLMDGEIEVESIPQKGTTFIVHLPLSEAPGQAPCSERFISRFFSGIHALVFTTDESACSSLRECFASFGIETQFAGTEDTALAFLQAAAHDERDCLLFADDSAASGGGARFVRDVRGTLSFSAALKCILLVPIGREDLLDQAEAAGVDCGLVKPVMPSVLYNAIVGVFHIEQSGAKEPAAQDIPQKARQPYRVLLIEDNQTNQFIAKTILEQAGFTVDAAENGLSGSEYYAAHQREVDLILMDLHMPVMDGYAASDKIRETDGDIPIVAMTADAISGVREKCEAHGIHHYVTKPFDPEQFIQTLLEILAGTPAKYRQAETPRQADPPKRVLDAADGVRHIGGDATLYRLILQTYLEESAETAAELETALLQHDFTAARDLAHKLKSSSGSVGAGSLHQTAAALQAALESAQADEAMRLFGEFSALFAQLTEEIRTYLREEPPE